MRILRNNDLPAPRGKRGKPAIAAIVLLLAGLGLAGRAVPAVSDYRRTEIVDLTAGARVDWSADGEWIYFDRRDPEDYYYDVYRIRPDGTDESCLTDGHPDLPNRHQGNPSIHPGGRWLLFQVEQESHFEADWDYNPCKPGGGYFNDLYVMDLESAAPRDVYPLTGVSSVLSPPGGSLHAHFSRDGARLLWGDLEAVGGRFGDWRPAVADFVTEPVPRLENHDYPQPGENRLWYETHSWEPGDRRVLHSAAPLPGMDGFAGDICLTDLSGPEETVRLTRTSGIGGEDAEWDEHGHFSPSGDVISWISSRGYGIHPEDDFWRGWLVTDLWLMNPDGSGKRQVTFFNVTGHDDFIPGEVACADNSWSPDGRALALTVYERGSNSTGIKLVRFAGRPGPGGGDYDGDGTSDIAVFRESSGLWAIRGKSRIYFGRAGDRPVPGDYDGDGTTDPAVFRPDSGLWALRGVTRAYFGSLADLPVPGDYDGDGTGDLAIFRPGSGLWAVRGVSRFYFGGGYDRPVPGDYRGDGIRQAGIFRPGSGLWALRGTTRFYFGGTADLPVPGDYDGDGNREPAIFRPSTGLWAVPAVTRLYFGGGTFSASPTDYDGDGTGDVGLFRSLDGLWAVRGVTRLYFGRTGDQAVVRGGNN